MLVLAILPIFTIILFIVYIFYIYLGMANSSDTVLAKAMLLVSFCCLNVLVAMFSYYVIRAIPSNAELHEN